MDAGQGARILVVEADLRLRKVRTELLRKTGYTVYPAANVEDATSRCKPDAYDAVVLRAESRFEANSFCERIRRVNPKQLIVNIEFFNEYLVENECADVTVSGHDPRGLLHSLANVLSSSGNRRRIRIYKSDEPK